MANEQLAKRYLELGALFVAVGVDTTAGPQRRSAGSTVYRRNHHHN
jgi:4-hydroxy-2-oxoheptanedioate aldolase